MILPEEVFKTEALRYIMEKCMKENSLRKIKILACVGLLLLTIVSLGMGIKKVYIVVQIFNGIVLKCYQ